MILDSLRYFYCFYKPFVPLLYAFLQYCTCFFKENSWSAAESRKSLKVWKFVPPWVPLNQCLDTERFENATVVLWSGQTEWYNLCLRVHYGNTLQLKSFFALPFPAFLIQISSGISTLVNHLHLCPVTEPASA